jgi:hypothetical protein
MLDLGYSPSLVDLREVAREAVSLERTLATVAQYLDVQIILYGEPWDPTLPPQKHLDFQP